MGPDYLENHVNKMALTDFELDVKEPQWTHAQFPSGETSENPQCGVLGMHIMLWIMSGMITGLAKLLPLHDSTIVRTAT